MNQHTPADDGLPGAELSDAAWLQRVADSDQLGRGELLCSYSVLELVARGGQGIVFKARDPETGQLVALKKLIGGAFATTQQRDRLRREIAIVERLEHPAIVSLRGLAEEDGLPVLVVDWVDGKPADRWALDLGSGESRVDTILSFFIQVCRAVEYAHDAGVIHRDLKPSNILVDADNAPHILDFGIALDDEDDGTRLTRTGEFLGSPPFCSPEQLDGSTRTVDARSDVYSLGALLYLLLTGELPIDTDTDPGGPAHAVATQQPRRPTQLVAGLPADIDNVLFEALCKEPRWRYDSVAAFADDVNRVLEGRPVRANPRSVARVITRSYQRRRLAYWLGGALLIVSSVLVIRTLTDARHASEQRTRSEDAVGFAGDILRSLRASPFGDQRSRPEVIQRAIDSAGERLADAPATHAALLEEIATLLLDEGDGDRAITTLKHALALRTPLTDEHATHASAKRLAEGLIRTGAYEEAERRLEPLLEEMAESPGPLLSETLLVAINLHLMRGDFEQAHDKRVEYVALNPAEHGTEAWVKDRVLALEIMGVGEQYWDALELSESFVKEAEALFGADHTYTGTALRRLGVASMQLGIMAESEAAFRRAVEVRRGLTNADDLLAESLLDLGQIWIFARQYDDALGLLAEAAELLAPMGEGHHAAAGLVLCYRGIALQRTGKLDDARADVTRALELQRKQLGPEHPSVAISQSTLGGILSDQGEHEQARAMMHRALEIKTNALGPDHRDLADMLNTIAVAEQKAGHLDTALDMFQRALSHLERTFPDGHQYMVFMHTNIARLHQEMKNASAAKASLHAALSYADEMGLDATSPPRIACLVGLQLARLLEVEDRLRANEPGEWSAQLDAAVEEVTRLTTDSRLIDQARQEASRIRAEFL